MRKSLKNRTAKSGKHQGAWREGKLLVLENIGSKHYQTEIEDQVRKEYLKRSRKLLETDFCSRNTIKGINTSLVPFIRYSGLFLKWTWVLTQTNKP